MRANSLIAALLLLVPGCSPRSTPAPDAGPGASVGSSAGSSGSSSGASSGSSSGSGSSGGSTGGSTGGASTGSGSSGGSTGGMDAGLPDAGMPDAGMPDAGMPDAGPVDAGDHGSPSNVYPAFQISYPQLVGDVGGIISAPKLVAVTWDGDPLRGDYEQFISSIGSSTYWATTTTEYGVGPAVALPPMHLPAPAPTPIDDIDIRSWLVDQLSAGDGGWPAVQDGLLVALAYPEGVSITLGGLHSCNHFGAYHGAVQVGSTKVAYAVMPRCPADPTDPVRGTDLALLTAVTSHEFVEAVTDIDATGYWLPDQDHLAFALFAGAETGDMCEFDPSAFIFDAQLNTAVQRTWSNAAALAGKEPCIPAPNSPHFLSVPAIQDRVHFSYYGSVQESSGLLLARGASATIQVELLSDADTNGPWTLRAIDRSAFIGGPAHLQFHFDRTTGQNGEKVYLTITNSSIDPNFDANPFAIISEQGNTKTYWYSLVSDH